MKVQDTLSTVDVAEVFEWVRAGEKTGALELRNDHFAKTIYFVAGTVAGIDSNEPADELPYRFLAMDLLTPEQVEAALALEQRTGKAFVDVLHATGAVMAAEMDEAIHQQALESLWSAFLWSDGQFEFRDGELPEDIPAAVSLEVDELLDEGRRRRTLATSVRARLERAGERFVWNPDSTPMPTKTSVERRLMQRLGTPWTVRELMTDVPAAEFEVLQLVDALLERRAIVEAQGDAPIVGAAPAVAAAPAMAARATAAGGVDIEEACATVAIGVLPEELPVTEDEAVVPTPAPRTPSEQALEVLDAARSAMDHRAYEEAVELFRRAERHAGGDPRFEMLRASAEGVYCEVLHRDGLGASRRPIRAGAAGDVGDLTPLAHRLLVEMDGHATVSEVVQATGADRIDGLKALRALVEQGLVALED